MTQHQPRVPVRRSSRFRDETGLTMTEILVTMFILGVVAAVVGGFFTNISRVFGFQSELAVYEKESRQAMDVMEREIRSAHSRDINNSDWTQSWPIQMLTGTEIMFFSLDRDDPDNLRAIRYWVEDSDRKLYRAEMDMVPTGVALWDYPGGCAAPSIPQTCWDANKSVLANDVLNTTSGAAEMPLFWNPDSPNEPGAMCDATDPADDTAVGVGFQALKLCLSLDRKSQELPAAFQMVGGATWRNPASKDQSQEPPGANGDLYLWASKTGQSATDGSQTWGAPSGCNKYGNGCLMRGDKLTYRIDYGNYGASAVLQSALTDVLDPQVNFVSASNGGTYDSGTRTVAWTPTLGGASQSFVTLTVEVSNTAAFSTNITNSSNWTVTKYQAGGSVVDAAVTVDTLLTTHKIATPLPNLAITTTTATTVQNGGNNYIDLNANGTFTVSVTNSGQGPATNTVIYANKIYNSSGGSGSTHGFHPSIQCVSTTAGSFFGCATSPTAAPRQWQWNVGTINPGQTVSATITLKPSTAAGFGAVGCDTRNFQFAVNATELGSPKTGSTISWRYRPCLEINKVATSPAANSNVARGATLTFKLQARSRNTLGTAAGVVYIDDLNSNGSWNLDTTSTNTTCAGANGWRVPGTTLPRPGG